jgi:hypothetical protein
VSFLNICANCKSISLRYFGLMTKMTERYGMKRVTGDDLSRLIQKNGVAYLSNSDVFVENNRVVSELYFARSRKYLIDTTDMSRFVAKEVTVIYLSFTNVRISITLPGGGVSLKYDTSGRYGRK